MHKIVFDNFFNEGSKTLMDKHICMEGSAKYYVSKVPCNNIIFFTFSLLFQVPIEERLTYGYVSVQWKDLDESGNDGSSGEEEEEESVARDENREVFLDQQNVYWATMNEVLTSLNIPSE